MPETWESSLKGAIEADMPKVYVGIGSNVNRDASVRAGVADLYECFGDVQLSTVYESKAIGFEGDPFYNLVAAFDTEESVDKVIALLSDIENRHGRLRSDVRYSPRTLDIDLLLYDDLVVTGNGYRIPRDEICRYAFVLKPLAELAPDRLHPETGESFATMWSRFDKSSQPLEPVEFSW